jgi:type IVB pilus formation R64 PilN family outer membrane protein
MTAYAKRNLMLVLASSLAGCGTVREHDEVRGAVKQGKDIVTKRMTQVHEDDTQKRAVVREIDGVWLGGRTVKVSRDAKLPAVFSQPIRFAFPDRPTLTVIGDRISKIVGISVRVSSDALIPIEVFSTQRMGAIIGRAGAMQAGGHGITTANSGRLPGNVTMPPPFGSFRQYAPSMSVQSAEHYAVVPTRSFILDQTSPFGGALAELPDQVSDKYGVGWDYKDDTILISRLVTRTYPIAAITDTNDVTSIIAKSTSAGGTNARTTQISSMSPSSNVSAKMATTMDVVKGLKAAIEGALTPNGIGKYSISSSGIVTVTDTRAVQEQIRELITAENQSAGRQVRVRLQIVDVQATTNNDFDMNFNWSQIIKMAAAGWGVDFSAPDGMTNGSTGFGQLGVLRAGGNSSTQTFLKALASIGKVNIRKDETYTLLNNRPLSVANTENFIYPARSSSATSTTSSATAVPGVDPGQLTTGTFLNMRTSIQPNNSVIVQFSLDASMRGNTKTFVSDEITLQYPQSTANQYQIYSSIVSGETAVLVGIDNTQQQSTDKSFDGTLSPLLGSGIATSSTRRAVLILLTPQIVEGVS